VEIERRGARGRVGASASRHAGETRGDRFIASRQCQALRKKRFSCHPDVEARLKLDTGVEPVLRGPVLGDMARKCRGDPREVDPIEAIGRSAGREPKLLSELGDVDVQRARSC